jgi:hypothetical protein
MDCAPYCTPCTWNSHIADRIAGGRRAQRNAQRECGKMQHTAVARHSGATYDRAPARAVATDDTYNRDNITVRQADGPLCRSIANARSNSTSD